jgi:hypothetical protein
MGTRRPRVIEAGAWEVQARPAASDAMKPGQRVFHQKFGYGLVTGVDDDKLDIEFERAGHKRVLDRFVRESLMKRHVQPLETLVLDGLPEAVVPTYEAALLSVSATVALFRDEPTDTWRIEAVRETTADPGALSTALTLAAGLTGYEARLDRHDTEADGWLARTVEAFPIMPIGRRFLIRPSHAPQGRVPGRIALTLDAGLAFGSGEHSSTRGCLMALERLRSGPGAPQCARAGPWLGQRHPGDGGGEALGHARAGDRHRAVVGAGGA